MKPLALCLLAGLTFSSHAQPAPTQSPSLELPGPRSDGSVLLPNQWSLRPAGKQVVVGDFPVNIAMHPSGRFAAVLHCGYGQHEIVVLDIAGAKVISRVNLDEAFYGLEFSADGRKLFSSGAGDEVIHAFTFRNGFLNRLPALRLRDAKEKGVPSGLALSRDGRDLFVANLWAHRVSHLDLRRSTVPAPQEILLSTTSGTQTPTIKPPAEEDLAAATKRGEALLVSASDADAFPYACRLDEKRKRLYVSLWAQATVAVIDLKTRRVEAHWPTEEHPNEMLLSRNGRWLFVANANRNTVTILDTDRGAAVETLTASMQPHSPPGSTPNSLALSPDEKLLFVANACNNNLAVFDVSEIGRSRSLGFIPTGWYPTSVRVTPDGKHLLVANGKGLISRPNRHGPQPGREPPATVREHIAGLMRGTVSIVEIPGREKFETELKKWTAQTYQTLPATALSTSPTNAATQTVLDPNHPIPRRQGDPSPIKYVLYLIKENRTYDQVLGDMPEGNGDPSLCLFPERVTPNHHQLARDFVLLDNFYVESEVSADGHEWTMGAYATDFVEKSWPLSYGHNKSGKYPYPSEGRFKISVPSGGYLWDKAREAGVSYRSYGEFINAAKNLNEPATTRVAALQGHFDEWYRPWDMDYPDVKRTERFLSELKRFEREGDMPRLQILRLGNDHTFGTTAGKPTPTAMVADNDLAFGRLVEGLSASKFWPSLALFVVEDDAQNGPDHVDAHRTIAYAISPYVKRGSVDSTMYSTASMLRTIELILGLNPMSQFDAAARPMYHSFQSTPDLRPYRSREANVDLNERNLKTAWGSKLSEKMNFAKEDAADDLLLNEVVWRSVRGPDSPMPPPTRAAFVFPHVEEEEED